MSRKINCNVFTPEGPVYNGEFDLAVIPAFDGEMGFLYNHAPLIAELGAGEVRLKGGNDTEYLFVEGGFAEIVNNELSIFPLYAVKKEDLSAEKIEKEIFSKKEALKTSVYKDREKLMNEISVLKHKIKAARRLG